MYIAHINENTEEIQTVKQHSESTAALCAGFAIDELKEVMYVMGLLHDIGKYQSDFQQRIRGESVRVEHSTCGAIVAREKYNGALGLIMEYCVAGHHSGIPDSGAKSDTPDMSTLYGRLKREFQVYEEYQKELHIPKIDEKAFVGFMMKDCGNSLSILLDKYAFFTRYCFSCLTDADSLDTASFCNGSENRSLSANFEACLKKVNARLQSFTCTTELQKTRAKLQQQVFNKTGRQAEIYLMNMPTGSGKTLCSVKFALERATRPETNKKRIIYIIPYNSIIEQTAEEFEKMFGQDAELLRHQSTFSYEDREDISEDYRIAIKHATENWDAQLIVTTAVQFFESIYTNRRGKLRKLHNMADSILVFDEAHLMPQEYLKPCLEAVSYITKYLNSEAVFLTATMPDFRSLMMKYALPNSDILDLIDDTSMFEQFEKCRFTFRGDMTCDQLVQEAYHFPSCLIVVNKRATAKKIYQAAKCQKYHLSTYMTAFDRIRVIHEIKEAVAQLEKDFTDRQHIPEERRILVVSTSLIEAGVDLDFHTVYRELSGLDSILQAAGRCNREGKRKIADVFIFQIEEEQGKTSIDEKTNIAKSLLQKYDRITSPECIREYYDRLYFMKEDTILKNAISQYCADIQTIPFKTYADHFTFIKSNTISIVAVRDERSKRLVEELKVRGKGRVRELQKYTFSVYLWEVEDLQKQRVIDDYGSGIWCLTNPDYYDDETGVVFEAKDYII